MFKKILITLSLIISAISFYMLVGKYEVSIKSWLLIAVAPYIFLAGFSLIIKSSWLQMVLVPSLLFYGIRVIINSEMAIVGWDRQYAYGYISAILMLILAVRFCLSNFFRLKWIKIPIGIVLGTLFLVAINHYRIKYLPSADLIEIPHLENKLFQ